MKKLKSMIALGMMVMAVGATTVTAFASSTQYNSSAEIVADLTDKTVEEILQEREETGKSYGQLAEEAGKYEQYREAHFEMRKAELQEDVASGRITQEEADRMAERMEENQAFCDGPEGYGRGQNFSGKSEDRSRMYEEDRNGQRGYRGRMGYRNGSCH